jgi:hypothetical protein
MELFTNRHEITRLFCRYLNDEPTSDHHLGKTGELPSNFEFCHLFSAADYPEHGAAPDLEVLTDSLEQPHSGWHLDNENSEYPDTQYEEPEEDRDQPIAKRPPPSAKRIENQRR